MGGRGRAVLALLGLAVLAPSPAGAADDVDDVELTARIDGTAASAGTEVHPVVLDPDRPVTLEVRITNSSDEDLTVRTIRLEGRVMGLAFFAYDTRVGLTVRTGHSSTHRFDLDLAGLRGQATGLIPARVVALDDTRSVVAGEDTVVDVRGSVRSVYGAFGLAVAGFTGLAMAGALVALARHQLAPNRWRRGVRFCWIGVGLGLLLVFTLSALRIFVPGPERWQPILAISTIALFLIGYLTPTPDDPADDPADDPVDDADTDTRDDEVAAAAAAMVEVVR